MVALTSALALLAVAGSAVAAPLESRQVLNGKIQSQLGNNLCVGLSGTSDGAKLLLQSCSDPTTDITYNDDAGTIVFKKAGRVADIPWGQYWNGQNPQIWNRGGDIKNGVVYGSKQQQWTRHNSNNQQNGNAVNRGDWQQIKTRNGGNYCLDVREGGVKAGAQVQIWACGGAANKNQAFRFI